MKKNLHSYGIIITVILVIFSGVALVLQKYNSYTESFMRQQDAKHMQIIQAVDKNLDALLKQSRNSFEYITELPDFKKAENRWLYENDSSDLLEQLSENHMEKNILLSCIIAMKNDEILLKTKGQTEYTFLNDDEKNSERLCLGSDGKVYLAIIHYGNQNASYASLLDLQRLYETVSSIELSNDDKLILLDEKNTVFFHCCDEQQIVKNTLMENCPSREDFKQMISAQEKQEQGWHSFIYKTKKITNGYNARIAILPSSHSQNERFAIGLVSNQDAATKPLKEASFYWLLGGTVILSGISMLLFLLMHYRRSNQQREEELELLRQKNIAMEELKQKTREMAHHQRLEMMGSLTSGIAHEFNNLLTPIMSYSLLTLERFPEGNDELYDYVLEIYQSSRKAKDITKQLSQFSRKRGAESSQYISVEKLLSEVLRTAKPACPKQVRIEQNFNSEDWELYGDEIQLSQLFLNIILNAFYVMSDGGVLKIETFVEQGQMEIVIADNGCGISEDILPHIFEPFYTTKDSGKGTGLGLAIAQQIAQEHQGNISVNSKIGEGSAFTISLPAYRKQ